MQSCILNVVNTKLFKDEDDFHYNFLFKAFPVYRNSNTLIDEVKQMKENSFSTNSYNYLVFNVLKNFVIGKLYSHRNIFTKLSETLYLSLYFLIFCETSLI